jgi:hypothetical protein
MATDQHYCVECGTRRGKPRFTLAKSATSAPASASASPPNVVAAGWTRMTALLAIAVVLLALGVGFLIGNSGASISQPVKVQITGGTLSTASATKSGSSSATKTTAKTTTKPAFSAGS